jgi:hypothetical protein
MKLTITYYLAISSLCLNILPASAIDINNLELNSNISSFDNNLLLANNKSNDNYLNKEQVKQYLNQYKQAKKCQITSNPKQNKNRSFNKYLFECIGYNFEVVSNQNKDPITALTVRSYPVLILQQQNRYKIKFSNEPRITSPRPIIVWTENGANEFDDQFTQLKRANIVTDKFNKHFISKGQIKVTHLSLGIINGQSVVCAAPAGNCRPDNVLWTLKKNNQRSNVISQLNDALKGNAATPLFESQDSSCIIKDDNIQTQGDSVDMTSLVKKVVTEEIQCVQNQESPEKIASELESSDNFEAIRSDVPPMISQNPTVESPESNPLPIREQLNNNPAGEESCWEQWDCEPTFDDLDPEFIDIDWDNF